MTESVRYLASDEEKLVALGQALGNTLLAGETVSLTGPLGAGKTTLTRGIALGLRVREPVSSPTFVIARRSPGERADLMHCDVYRLGSPQEAEDLGLDTSGAVTVVEWGRTVMPWIADEWLDIEIDRSAGEGDDNRVVTLRPGGRVSDEQWRRWIAAVPT